MNACDLGRYGVPDSLTEIWAASSHRKLLPVQEIAVRRYGLFQGENLIVSAPTSSGKTFIGEMAAAHHMAGGRRSLYLVPLKALAAEKFDAFRRRYEPLGADVVIASRDHQEYDDRIAESRFDIAIVVYEKMQQILTSRPAMLQSVGLVVADELQMVADPERGPGLEMLLTRIKLSGTPFQFIGLSAVLKNSAILSQWLDARFLEHYQRPVELRQGILYNGMFRYETYNSRDTGEESLVRRDKGSHVEIMVANAVHLAERGEQSLVFLSDKNTTRMMAQVASQGLKQGRSPAAEELGGVEETLSGNMLRTCLASGVAFHNADLSRDEREIVERHFTQGNIKIVCCTPTLALGVNLPAKNVFIEPMLWDRDERTGRPHKRPISRAECENMAGRAGRLHYEDQFGRAILVAKSRLEYQGLCKRYFEADLEELQPRLKRGDMATHSMNLVASGLVHTEEEIAKFLAHTLTGLLYWRALHEYRGKFRASIAKAVERCIEYGLLAKEGGRLKATALGGLCAVKGVCAATGYAIANWLRAAKGREFAEMEAVYALARTDEAQALHVNMSTDEYRSWAYPGRLLKQLPRAAQDFFPPLADGRIHQTYEEVKCMKVALLLSEWIGGERAVAIEQAYSALAGTIRGAGEVAAWLADAAAGAAELLECPKAQTEALSALAARLAMGIPAEGIELAQLRVRGFGRQYILRLLESGIDTLDAVQSAPEDELKEVLGGPLAAAVCKSAAALRCREEGNGVACKPWTKAESELLRQELTEPATV